MLIQKLLMRVIGLPVQSGIIFRSPSVVSTPACCCADGFNTGGNCARLWDARSGCLFRRLFLLGIPASADLLRHSPEVEQGAARRPTTRFAGLHSGFLITRALFLGARLLPSVLPVNLSPGFMAVHESSTATAFRLSGLVFDCNPNMRAAGAPHAQSRHIRQVLRDVASSPPRQIDWRKAMWRLVSSRHGRRHRYVRDSGRQQALSGSWSRLRPPITVISCSSRRQFRLRVPFAVMIRSLLHRPRHCPAPQAVGQADADTRSSPDGTALPRTEVWCCSIPPLRG